MREEEEEIFFETKAKKVPFWKSPKCWLIFAFLAIGVAGITVAIVFWATTEPKPINPPPGPPLSYWDSMNVTRMIDHLKQLETIAYSHEGSRTAITGYNASVEYVVSQLKSQTNYDVSVEYFTFPFYRELSTPTLQQVQPQSISYVNGQDFRTLRFSGSGFVEGNIFWVNGGCTAQDFAAFPANSIAFMARNKLEDCSLTTKITNAAQFNAIGVLAMYDPGTTGLFSSGLANLAPFPAFSLTFSFGSDLKELLAKSNVRFQMNASTEAPVVTTMNILAETKTGSENDVIVVGSHLDSVPAGPGINDNGSGSSVNLELALQLYKMNINLKNKVRFAWWAAEEFGLLGSKYYVSNLNATNPEGLGKIACNLNFDMLGSPNYYLAVYNGSSGNANVKEGSTKIQQLFETYFQGESSAFDLTAFDGRSDYGPFIAVGIPAGGLFSGAEVPKTMEGRKKYGGLANTPYDPCYHQSCDTVENINHGALELLSQAAAYTVQTLAQKDNLRLFLNSQ